MYSVLIADDEARDRSILKILLERQYPGTFSFLEAENGEQTLQLLREQKIQLLFLDMNMPGLTGVDVLHKMPCTPYVIVLTAYNDFEYTREALRCGVRDYLLKPPLRSELYQAVDSFIESSEQLQESMNAQIQQREVFTQDLARQLMYFGDPKKMRGLLNVLEISEPYALCSVLRSEQQADILLGETEEVLNRWGARYAATTCSEGLVVFFFTREETAADSLNLLSRLARHLENNLCTTLQLQTGPLALIEGGYPKAYLEMVKYNETIQVRLHHHLNQSVLENAICSRNFSAAMEALRLPLEGIGGDEAHADIMKYQILLALSRCTSQVRSEKAAEEAYRRISGLISACGREEVTAITAQYLEWLIGETQETRSIKNNVVQEVLLQVRADCSQPWSIETLAEAHHVTASHLSHLFKEYTGTCFTDYLAELRISRAVELIRTTSLGLAQIGDQVGYSDPNYFSRVFKKRRGVGPREFSRSQN